MRAGIKPRAGCNVASVISTTFNFLKHLLCDEAVRGPVPLELPSSEHLPLARAFAPFSFLIVTTALEVCFIFPLLQTD